MVNQKKLVDEVSGWLRVYDDGSVDRTWTGPPEVKFMVEPVPAHVEFINGVAVRDTVTNNNLRVRLYLPEKVSNEEKLPIFLHFHGGGFCISEPDWFMYYQFYSQLARLARVIVVSCFLRRAPENRLPAAIDDGFSALLWLQDVAGRETEEPWLEKHGDFRRVFLIGDSSGANIVHEVAARAGKTQLKLISVAGGIPIHPGMMRSTRSRSELEKPQSPFLTLDMVDKFMSLALPLGSTKDHPIACPMGDSAPPLSGLKLPPFLLCLAELDLIFDTEMEYYEAMRMANKDVELYVNEGVTHSFYLNKIAVDMDPNTGAQTHALMARIKQFIEEH
ncbi:probable carboxylesterase 15 [Vigna radiata var. radiata]|uniref:Probable carboxylesterase 15 n=1 Tax=Vigna radiata var. radiata TaxID=3916 RepID=A0A1S3UDU4_VIGRR|nr:probable carboxylesterase 15 [Vigna radiata var. radiata]